MMLRRRISVLCQIEHNDNDSRRMISVSVLLECVYGATAREAYTIPCTYSTHDCGLDNSPFLTRFESPTRVN